MKKRVERIVLEPENENGPRGKFQPTLMYYESNTLCYVCIDCPTHKKAKDLIKQLFKDQKDLVKLKKELKERKAQEKSFLDSIQKQLDQPTYQQDYNEP